jgi:hypothetical protein
MGLFGRKQSPDEQALERYRYMLRTAPPETIEQAHAEAFAQLTPEQRRMLLQQLGQTLPAAELAAAQQSGASPQALARLATRAEMRQPGSAERMFGQAGGMSMGGVMATSFLSSIAGAVIGSMIAREFFSGADQVPGDAAPDWESAGADQAPGEGGGFDMGGGFDL